MENRIYLMDLFDLYGKLFTEKQQEYFIDYYFNNLTLAEIGENNNISRAAVHSTIKEVEQKLIYYEDKIKLYKKRQELEKVIDNLNLEQKNKIKKILEDE